MVIHCMTEDNVAGIDYEHATARNGDKEFQILISCYQQ